MLNLLLEVHELPFWGAVMRASIILGVGAFLASMLSRGAVKAAGKRIDAQQSMLLRRFIFYGVLIATVLSALHEMGFNPAVLVGTAGVLTVALGFASQTSASNIISGLFLVGERSFVVGDRVKIGETMGEVLSIDLLSVKLRTFDNLFVRIPNETMLRSEVTNIGRFPIRRYELTVGVDYRTDLDLARKVLLDVAHEEPLALEDPAPSVFFSAFADSSMNLRLLVWTARDNYFTLINRIPEAVKRAFDAADITIPFPQRTLHIAGNATWPGSEPPGTPGESDAGSSHSDVENAARAG